MTRKTITRTVLLLAGIGLLGAFIYSAGPGEIIANVKRIGWGFVALMGLSLLWRSLAATGMWLLFEKEHGLSWMKVMLIRWAGEAVNSLMPFGNVGGEPVKAMLLSREMRGTEATGYVLLDKTIFFIGSVAFMTSGALIGAVILAEHPAVLLGTIGLLVPWVLTLAWIVWRQAKGDFVVQVSRVLGWVRIKLSDKTKKKLERVDGTMKQFWKRRRGRFVASLLVHSTARVLRAADVFLCVYLLGETISWTGAYFTAAAGMLVSTTFFFIPGALGASEGGHAFVFDMIGLGLTAGVTVGLVRRIRNYTLSAIGYVIFVTWPAKPDTESESKTDTETEPATATATGD